MRVFILILSLLVSTHLCIAQSFRNYTAEQGLPEAQINAVCDDVRGLIWIATTTGLVSFDGYSFVVFRSDDGLGSDVIQSVTEGHDGRLWIGMDNGLCTYDGKRFRRVAAFEKMSVSNVKSIDGDAVLVQVNQRGLYRYIEGKQPVPFSAHEISGKQMRDFTVDAAGTVWVVSSIGVGKFGIADTRVLTSANGLPIEPVQGISAGAAGRIWIRSRDGVAVIDGDRYTALKKMPASLGDITALSEDSEGLLWVGTVNGLTSYDGTSFNTHPVDAGQGKVHITTLFRDRSGNLWCGSAAHGLFRLNRDRFTRYGENDQMGRHVYSIIQSFKGNLLCGTSRGGITVVDGKNFTLIDKRDGFTSSRVQCLHYAKDSSLWVGTLDDGLFRFAKSQTQHFTREDGLISENITAITSALNGELFVGTSGGLMLIDVSTDSLNIVHAWPAGSLKPELNVTTLFTDLNGAVWAGTQQEGIIHLTPSDSVRWNIVSYNEQKGLHGKTIHTIVRHNGWIIAGTSHGVWMHDGKTTKEITRMNGLSSNTVYSLTIDHDGVIWAGTDRELHAITIDQTGALLSLRSFGSRDGYPGREVYRNAAFTTKDGTVWFGTVNGLIAYTKKRSGDDTLLPKAHITGVKIGFDPIQATPYGDSLSAWYPVPKTLSLPHNQNNITISFVGIHHVNPDAVQYRWKLDGFRDAWSPPVKDREAVFTNLSPGHYRFHLQASGSDGRWDESPAEFVFTIDAPWWTWTSVRISGIAAILGLMWVVFYVRLQQIKKRSRIRQERLELHNHILELEHEASRLQMNPHFIFNCLNSIQGLISANQQEQAKRYLSRFGKLMRMILENSREEFIPLENEMSILRHYLELEQITVANPFTFSVECDHSVDALHVEIPPMLIQPFAENAVVHGVRRLNGGGIISIHFALADRMLTCTVTDNGVGREAAARFNEGSSNRHKSKALEVTSKRLAQFGNTSGLPAGIEIKDLYDSAGKGCGTKVSIRIPLAH